MPRHPFRTELSDEIRRYAGLGSEYITELSYQTESRRVWISMTRGNKTIEHSVAPEPKTLIRQIGKILRIGKIQMEEDRKLTDYIDPTITLPNKP